MIRLLGLEYSVRLTSNHSDLDSQHDGQINYSDCSVNIRADINRYKQQQTFLHEVFHGIVEGESKIGNSKQNEAYVTRVSNTLFGFLVDNNLLAPGWWDKVVDEQPAWLKSRVQEATRGKMSKVDY